MASVGDDCSEVISILRGAARTPLRGMTPSEIESRTRLTLTIVRSCIGSLLESERIARVGQRNGEDVYGLAIDG